MKKNSISAVFIFEFYRISAKLSSGATSKNILKKANRKADFREVRGFPQKRHAAPPNRRMESKNAKTASRRVGLAVLFRLIQRCFVSHAFGVLGVTTVVPPPRSERSNGAFVAQEPPVKSGKSIGLESCVTDHKLSGVTALHVAPS